MKKQFVTYEIAKKLKELGLNEPCISEFTIMKDDARLHLNNHFNTNEKIEPNLPAPLWQQVIDWLIEKFDLHICVEPYITSSNTRYEFKIMNSLDSFDEEWNQDGATSRQEAIEQAILKAIELI